jgi:hypothetical protein
MAHSLFPLTTQLSSPLHTSITDVSEECDADSVELLLDNEFFKDRNVMTFVERLRFYVKYLSLPNISFEIVEHSPDQETGVKQAR